jgi:serpin B
VLINALHLDAPWADPFSDTESATFSAPSGDEDVDMMSGSMGAARTADEWRSVELPYRDGTDEPRDVGVRLPRLRIEQSHGLLEVLAAKGLPIEVDYSALGGDGPATSQVVQKTFMEVDEDGTEAAAATGVSVGVSAGAPVTPEVVIFDRPFLFLLTDTETRSPLFVTVVGDPSARAGSAWRRRSR